MPREAHGMKAGPTYQHTIFQVNSSQISKGQVWSSYSTNKIPLQGLWVVFHCDSQITMQVGREGSVGQIKLLGKEGQQLAVGNWTEKSQK